MLKEEIKGQSRRVSRISERKRESGRVGVSVGYVKGR